MQSPHATASLPVITGQAVAQDTLDFTHLAWSLSVCLVRPEDGQTLLYLAHVEPEMSRRWDLLPFGIEVDWLTGVPRM